MSYRGDTDTEREVRRIHDAAVELSERQAKAIALAHEQQATSEQRAARERNEAIGRAIGRPLGWVLGFLGHAVLRGVAAKIEEKVEGKRK